ncbi:MAG: sigma-70 family RNA polymerase sigma factor [Bdellovibrionales bacterium]|nr:sigma-70 family RNA polymerase sigma factor [Bdellovibrionales bacterium]
MKVEGAESLKQSQDEAELSRLMRSSQKGDAGDYRQLLLRIRSMLAKYIDNAFARFGFGTGSSQEDVLQEVLLAIHVKRHTYDPEQFFLPWMYAIARYKIIDYIRKNKAFSSALDIEEELEHIESMASLDLTAEVDLEKLLEILSDKQRNVLKLVKLEGLSVEEAADKTGYTVSDVKVTIHRAMKTLQEKVKEDARENR